MDISFKKMKYFWDQLDIDKDKESVIKQNSNYTNNEIK